jgi:hypothetical protein
MAYFQTVKIIMAYFHLTRVNLLHLSYIGEKTLP